MSYAVKPLYVLLCGASLNERHHLLALPHKYGIEIFVNQTHSNLWERI